MTPAFPLAADDRHRPIGFGGQLMIARRDGLLYWPDRHCLVVSDLHLEKAAAAARRGALLPPYDTGETIGRLAQAIGELDPAQVIALGDSFHDRAGAQGLGAGDLDRLSDLIRGRDWLWIEGNHDGASPARLGGRIARETHIDGLVFRHQAQARLFAQYEVSGHWHPAARVRLRAAGVRAPCFVTDGNRLVLPAFGALTGGLDVTAPELWGLFPHGFSVILAGRDRAYAFPHDRLMADRRGV